MREAPALEANDVEAGERGAIAERNSERDEVMLDPGKTADEGVSANANELVDGDAAAQIGEIADLAMARRASHCWT